MADPIAHLARAARLADIHAKVLAGERLSFDDGVRLFASKELMAIGAMANLGESDSGSSATPDVEHVSLADVSSSDADRGLELSTEGEQLSGELADWARSGASGDLAGACVDLDEAKTKMARIRAIVHEMEGLDSVSSLTMAKLRRGVHQMGRSMSPVEQGCAAIGF